MIVLWGIKQDGPLKAVYRELSDRAAETIWLDQFEFRQHEIEFSETNPTVGYLTTHSGRIELSQVSAFYMRPYDSRRILKAAKADDPETELKLQLFDDAVLTWADLTPALAINRPSAMHSNSSKPYQSSLIEAAGFDTPETLLTSDAAEAINFLAKHPECIYKSIGGTRSKVAMIDHNVINRLKNCACPLQMQEYVAGTDVRVHVILGTERVFACSITSRAADYRYPNSDSESPCIEPIDLPHEIAHKCISLSRELGLAFSGIDLRRSPTGDRWVCFEVNPSPGYTYYEQSAGLPITEALCDLLISGNTPVGL